MVSHPLAGGLRQDAALPREDQGTGIPLKGTVSRDFQQFFLLFAEKIRPGPHVNKQKWLRELFYLQAVCANIFAKPFKRI